MIIILKTQPSFRHPAVTRQASAALFLYRLSVWHWISIRLESMLIRADCSLHRALKQHRKVISSLRTWPGLLLLPTCNPLGATLWKGVTWWVNWKRGSTVHCMSVGEWGRKRDGGAGSKAWWHFAVRRSWALLTVWNLPLHRRTLGAALSSSCVYQAGWRAPSRTVRTHTLLHNYHSIDKKAIPSSNSIYCWHIWPQCFQTARRGGYRMALSRNQSTHWPKQA